MKRKRAHIGVRTLALSDIVRAFSLKKTAFGSVGIGLFGPRRINLKSAMYLKKSSNRTFPGIKCK